MLFNKKKLRSSIFIIVLFISFTGKAHSPSISSTLLINESDSTWIMQVRGSLTAFEQEVHARYGTDSYSTPEEFKNLVNKMLLDDIKVEFDGNSIDLYHPKVKLGHETVAIIQFKHAGPVEHIKVRNAVFKNVYNNKSTVYVIRDNLEKNKFTLNKANDYQTKIRIADNKALEITEDISSNNQNWWIYGILGLIAILMIGLVFRKPSQK